MPNFNRDALKRGSEAIREATESRGQGGNFKPFLPSIYWKNDGDEHILLILNPIEDIPRVEFHPFIEVEGQGFPLQTMARTDPAIGESIDPIQTQWKYKPRLTNLAVAVELEATYETKNGRQRPVGFTVKTRDFTRRVRDEDGELTEEREDVSAPSLGLIAQSPYNFGNQLSSYDATEGPIHRTALKIKRLGKDNNVTYQVVGYEDTPVDLTPLIEGVEFISYIQKPEELLGAIDGQTDEEAAVTIGSYVLDLKLDEFSDPDLYNEIFGQITRPSRFGEKEAAKTATRQAKPKGKSSASVEKTEEPVAEEPKVTKASSAKERLEALRARSEKA